jgi:parafibromin
VQESYNAPVEIKDNLIYKDNLASRTTILLEGTSNYFEKLQQERAQLQSRQLLRQETAQSPASSLDSRPRRRLGLAPWHRRNSHESVLSVSSSVHRLLQGMTPAATPVLERRYIGSDGKEYLAGIDQNRQHNIMKRALTSSS